jgi:hypothetical protein
MNDYIIHVVVGNTYEVRVRESSLQLAQGVALAYATDGELIEGGRAILASEELPEEN